ncbi:MAG: SIS domain-containing protein [Halanaerobium sp.]|nr:SIS domain-containing protein [Halanaerobium sp.]
MFSEKYFAEADGVLKKVRETQHDAINEAARLAADTIINGGLIHAFGTGHSHMIAEEAYFRAGGLLPVNAILETALMLEDGPLKSSAMEKLPGLARIIAETQPFKEGDTIIIISNSGRNAVPVEMAMEAKDRGLQVVAITSLNHSRSVSSRHESGKKLYELADVVIDNCGITGDAILQHPGVLAPFAATSSLAGIYIYQAFLAQVVHLLVEAGEEPPILISGNVDEGQQHNMKLLEKYASRLSYVKL